MPLHFAIRWLPVAIVAVAVAPGCATKPTTLEPQRPLVRSLEIPLSLTPPTRDYTRLVSQGTYPEYKPPQEGTYELLVTPQVMPQPRTGGNDFWRERVIRLS